MARHKKIFGLAVVCLVLGLCLILGDIVLDRSGILADPGPGPPLGVFMGLFLLLLSFVCFSAVAHRSLWSLGPRSRAARVVDSPATQTLYGVVFVGYGLLKICYGWPVPDFSGSVGSVVRWTIGGVMILVGVLILIDAYDLRRHPPS